jgi:hypothetical protein
MALNRSSPIDSNEIPILNIGLLVSNYHERAYFMSESMYRLFSFGLPPNICFIIYLEQNLADLLSDQLQLSSAFETTTH